MFKIFLIFIATMGTISLFAIAMAVISCVIVAGECDKREETNDDYRL